MTEETAQRIADALERIAAAQEKDAHPLMSVSEGPCGPPQFFITRCAVCGVKHEPKCGTTSP